MTEITEELTKQAIEIIENIQKLIINIKNVEDKAESSKDVDNYKIGYRMACFWIRDELQSILKGEKK